MRPADNALGNKLMDAIPARLRRAPRQAGKPVVRVQGTDYHGVYHGITSAGYAVIGRLTQPDQVHIVALERIVPVKKEENHG